MIFFALDRGQGCCVKITVSCVAWGVLEGRCVVTVLAFEVGHSLRYGCEGGSNEGSAMGSATVAEKLFYRSDFLNDLKHALVCSDGLVIEPATDVLDVGDRLSVGFDVPCLDDMTLLLRIVRGRLVMCGDLKPLRHLPTHIRHFFGQAFVLGRYEAEVALPESVDIRAFDWVYNDGMLWVHFAKRQGLPLGSESARRGRETT